MSHSSGGPFICFLRLALPVNRKSPIPNGLNLGGRGEGREEGSEEGTMKKERVVVGTGNLAGRPLSSVFERRTAILLRILDRRAASGKNLPLVNFASEIDFGHQGRRELVSRSRHGRSSLAASG